MFNRHQSGLKRGRALVGADLTIRSSRDRDRYVVAPVGELDLTTVPQLEQVLRRVEASDACEILLDLGGLALIDSVGMTALIRASARSRVHHKPLMILSGPEHVQRCFEYSGLTSRLPFVEREGLSR